MSYGKHDRLLLGGFFLVGNELLDKLSLIWFYKTIPLVRLLLSH